jgi:hypothetical protein
MKFSRFDRNSSRGQWHIVAGLALALLAGACATEGTDPPATGDSFTAQINDNGVIKEIPNISPSAASPEAILDEKAGCVHIRFCTTPGTTNTITCDTNDRVCSSDARFNECLGDAQSVCGRQLPMAFDPGIPCPITGLCSSGTLLLIF